MIWELVNAAFCGNDPLPPVSNGDTLILCNFTQQVAGTQIFNGIKDLKFISCNCQNVVPASTWKDDSEKPSNWSEAVFEENWEEVTEDEIEAVRET